MHGGLMQWLGKNSNRFAWGWPQSLCLVTGHNRVCFVCNRTGESCDPGSGLPADTRRDHFSIVNAWVLDRGRVRPLRRDLVGSLGGWLCT
jgi:hypothetical protein